MENTSRQISIYTVANPTCQAGSIITFMNNASLLPRGFVQREQGLLEAMEALRKLPRGGIAKSLPLAEGRLVDTPGGSHLAFQALSFRGEELVSVAVDSPRFEGFFDKSRIAAALHAHGTNMRIIGIADAGEWASHEIARLLELEGDALLCNYRLVAPDKAGTVASKIAGIAALFEEIRMDRVGRNSKLAAKMDAESRIDSENLSEWALEHVAPHFNFAQAMIEIGNGTQKMGKEMLEYAEKFLEYEQKMEPELRAQVIEYVQIVNIIKDTLVGLRDGFFARE